MNGTEKKEEDPQDMSEELADFINLFYAIINKPYGDTDGGEIHNMCPQ